jgi:hypothetical protein
MLSDAREQRIVKLVRRAAAGRYGATLSFVTLVRTCSVLPELSPRQRKAILKISNSWCTARS